MRTGNLILDRLEENTRDVVLRASSPFELPKGALLYKTDEITPFIYFVTEGVCSILVRTEGGNAGGITLAGKNSAIGAEGILGAARMEADCLLHTEGYGIRIARDVFRKLFGTATDHFQPVMQSIQCHLLMTQRTASCNVIHSVEQRLAQWLLMFTDLSSSETIQITQEQLADILMVQRTTISGVSNSLSAAGTITQTRGSINILDRSSLERRSCDCYDAWCRLNACISSAE